MNNSNSSALSNATSGYHYHLVEAASEERLDLIEEQLKSRTPGTASSHGSRIQNRKETKNDNSRNSAGDPAYEKKNRMYVFWLMLIKVREILEVADYMGDSYGLSVQASKSKCSGVIMCGVRFMAETCKILSPDKKYGCQTLQPDASMAEQLDLEGLRTLKAE